MVGSLIRPGLEVEKTGRKQPPADCVKNEAGLTRAVP